MAREVSGCVVGDDSLPRCPWADSPADLRRYHDLEWGRPVHGDAAVFERLVLEAFQSGLSWLTILRKRPAFRAAFRDFDIETVAAFGEDDVGRLLADPGIVRNSAKVNAAIANARVAARVRAEDGEGALDRLVWAFAERGGPAPSAAHQVPAATPGSRRLAAELKARGWRFIGPTSAYAAMQALGLVDDHLAGCASRRAGPGGREE